MRYGFNLKNAEYVKNIRNRDLYEFNLLRNMALISGDGDVVRYFYQQVANSMQSGSVGQYAMQEIQQSFLYRASFSNPFVFYGITRMINKGITRLLTSGGVEFEGKYKTRLKPILQKSEFDRKFGNAVSQVSGLGDTLIRVAVDKFLTNQPIIEVISPENYELIIRRGIIVGYILKVRKTIEKTDYERQEIYRSEKDNIVIEYKIIDDAGIEIDLTKRTQKEIGIIREFGLEELAKDKTFPVIVLNGLKRMPIVYKTNTEVNEGLRGIPDTQGLHTIESALSEVLSNMVNQTRKAGLKVLIDQRLVPVDANGMPMDFDDFETTFVLTRQEGMEADKLIQTAQGLITSDKFIEASKYLIAIACNKGEIHPLTIGVTGLESVIASAESQQEREGKTSLRKRELMIKEWTPKLQELALILLEMDDYVKNNGIGDYNEEEIEVLFNPHTNPTAENVIDLMGKEIEAGLKSIKEAIKERRPDIDDDTLELAYAQIKSEKGLPLTPREMALLGAD